VVWFTALRSPGGRGPAAESRRRASTPVPTHPARPPNPKGRSSRSPSRLGRERFSSVLVEHGEGGGPRREVR